VKFIALRHKISLKRGSLKQILLSELINSDIIGKKHSDKTYPCQTIRIMFVPGYQLEWEKPS
jgi:hypothetical protein